MNISTFFPLEDCSLIFADVKWILYLFSAINAYFFWLVVFGVLFAYKSTTFLLLILQIFLCFVIYVSHPKDLELFALFCFKVECILVINNDVESTSLICFLLLCVRNYFFFFFAFLDVFCMTKMGANNFKDFTFFAFVASSKLAHFSTSLGRHRVCGGLVHRASDGIYCYYGHMTPSSTPICFYWWNPLIRAD